MKWKKWQQHQQIFNLHLKRVTTTRTTFNMHLFVIGKLHCRNAKQKRAQMKRKHVLNERESQEQQQLERKTECERMQWMALRSQLLLCCSLCSPTLCVCVRCWYLPKSASVVSCVVFGVLGASSLKELCELATAASVAAIGGGGGDCWKVAGAEERDKERNSGLAFISLKFNIIWSYALAISYALTFFTI